MAINSNEVRVIVPTNASTGPLVVTTAGGSAQVNFTVLGASITSITPDRGPVGTLVTVTGSNFSANAGLLFTDQFGNYTYADDIVVNPDPSKPAGTVISGYVPVNAVTGKIAIDDDEGNIVEESVTLFTVTPPAPTITSLSPSSGPVGTIVRITGTNLSNPTSITFNGTTALEFGEIDANNLQVKVPAGATSGPLVVTTAGGEASITYSVATSITSFTPDRGPVGTLVTVTGTDFSANAGLMFTDQFGNYTYADDIVVNPDPTKPEGTVITGYVPVNAVTGKIAIDNDEGVIVVESTSLFTVLPPAPTITSLSPSSGPVGTIVRITGTNLSNPTSITFNGTTALEFGEIDANNLQVKVPAGATSGPLVVTTAGGEAQAMFYVGPTITSLSPNSGLVGTKVTVKGSNLKDITAIAFNGTAVSTFENLDANTITMNVPTGATSGPMTVTTLGGEASAPFTVLEPEPLPVELMDFAGKGTSKGIILTWKTASEKDNAYFEVQTSANPTKEGFVTIGRVDSKVTNSSVVQSYEFINRTPKAPVTYYRLKQVDLDGASELSKVIAVNKAVTEPSNAQVKVYPNPFVQNLNVEVDAAKAGELTVVLYYVTGKKAFEQTFTVESGVSTVELPLNNSSLSSGIYILTTELNGQVTTARVIKQ
ncbi:hypothetical protein TH63_17980 [Rufibacter radiotolerans]|uniref:IPT/TIG domain-containing protein n=2 Tax=Rufibacter radiotolerans TaxID=1379910 RepID=A0A0H4W9I2_9BACT|nr:hypothetical protein TH63_17980 [Rufibacter radiotolerans]